MIRRTIALMAALALSACSGSSSNLERPETSLAGLREGIARLAAPEAPPVPLTAERMRAAGLSGSVLTLALEERGLNAALTPELASGRTLTWTTADGVRLSTRSGLLAATRGLGQDVLDAVTAPGEAAVLGGRPADYVRGMTVLGGGNRPYVIGMRCALRRGGAVLGPSAWSETCALSRPDGAPVAPETIRNEYLVAPGRTGPVVRASRQWVGPRTGYITLRRYEL